MCVCVRVCVWMNIKDSLNIWFGGNSESSFSLGTPTHGSVDTQSYIVLYLEVSTGTSFLKLRVSRVGNKTESQIGT